MYKLVYMRILIAAIIVCCGVCAINSCSDEKPAECFVFSPNGDGVNDVFEVVSENDDAISLKIYTRTGVLVFSIEAVRCRWDGHSISGEEMSTGLYYFTVETVETTPKPITKGIVCLFR